MQLSWVVKCAAIVDWLGSRECGWYGLADELYTVCSQCEQLGNLQNALVLVIAGKCAECS